MTEPHKRYPRSSFFYAMDNCEAAYELSVASGEEPPTVYAEKGTAVHRVLARKADPATLEPADADLARDLDEKRVRMEDKWLDGKQPDEVLIEERLWMRDGLTPIYSGQPDRVVRFGKRIYIPDFKTGWHPLDHFSATNCQLRSYVPLADEYFDGIEEALVAIIKPGKQSPPALFGPEEIIDARIWAVALANRATKPGPKTPNKGPWCTYCSGKVLCPLWRAEVLSFAERANLVVSEIPDAALAELAPQLEMAATVIKKLQDRLWGRVQLAPENFPDWRLEPGDKRRSIENLGELYERVVTRDAALSFDEFLEACKISIGAVEGAIRKNKQYTWAETYEYFARKLGDLITIKPNRSKLIYDPKPKQLQDVVHA
jgi:uncharacterized protein DUF2800